jgi:hypothetical protein
MILIIVLFLPLRVYYLMRCTHNKGGDDRGGGMVVIARQQRLKNMPWSKLGYVHKLL